ncbi:VOC family protein [Sphingomonas sp.]|uniref:VOC family protein n=1 Tax=Sphingomonas sp. TaxID=28214 RepID=UPI003CC63679
MVPILRVRSVAATLPFYLDQLGCRVHLDAGFYAVLALLGEELHLQEDGAAPGRQSAMIRVADADAAWAGLLARGWRPPSRPESPVHAGPVDQSWGQREFYVDDPDGNTIVYAGPP